MTPRQCAKIREIADALVAEGFLCLDERAKALGLSRSTTWWLLKADHKASGLSAAVINRMLASSHLPPVVRQKILEYVEEKGNPSDEIHVAPSLERHMEAFGRAPELYGSDRGFFSERNVASCAQNGVTVVCIPQRGGKKTPEREAYEESADFKAGQCFRAGIEGRISVLFRGRGMKRCLAEGHERFELWVAAAVLANNLMKVAALLTRRSSRRRKIT